MDTNPLPIFLAALIPMAVGFAWYHEKLFGKAWRNGAGLTAEAVAKGPKPIVFLISYVLSLMLSFALYGIAVHQGAIQSLFMSLDGFGQDGSAVQTQFEGLMAQFAGHHRSFGHGAFHGAIVGVFLAAPILVTNGMFEQRPWKLNAINVGYWILTAALMGGVVCQFA